jgi:hypothetical protein
MYSIDLCDNISTLEPLGHKLRTQIQKKKYICSVILFKFCIIRSLILIHKITIMRKIILNEIPIYIYYNHYILKCL